MSPFVKHVSALMATAFLAGCGDPIADGDYRGEPLLRIEGRLEGDARTSAIQAPYLGIVWLVFDPYSGEGTGRLVTSVVPVPDATFPGAFHLELYDPPPPEAFGEILGVRFAMGAIVALDDADRDRRFSMDPMTGEIVGADRFFGSSFWYQMLVYVERVEDADCARVLWTNPEAITPGRYQLSSMEECGFAYTMLPPETPIRLILFPTAPVLPDVPPNHVEPTCEPDCEADPGHPACVGDDGSYLCQLQHCSAESDAFDGCVNTHCLEARDFWGCSSEYCDPEWRAMSACMEEHCSGLNLCAYF